MGIYSNLPEDLDEVDVIVAGGGTAGCIVAGRLAAADPNLSVLVIEFGRSNYQDPICNNPYLWKVNLAPAAQACIYYIGNQAPEQNNRRPTVPAGGMLGGGSSVNAMMYARAQRSDFDSWKTPGWSADELIPYLKKLETYHGPGDMKTHGADGPVHISDGGYRSKLVTEDVLQGVAALGYAEVEDLQDLENSNGFQRFLRHASPQGQRQDTAHTHVHPLVQGGQHPNLHVLVQHKVVRVVLDEESKRAMGVEYAPNADFSATLPLSKPQASKTIKARKMVVVSAGTCGSPAILERSGIGAPEILQRANVPTRVELPGVGNNYQDHQLTAMTYLTSLGEDETPDRLYEGKVSPQELLQRRDPQLGWNAVDIAAKVRPTEEEVAALGPEFQAAWNRDFRDNPNRPLMLMGLIAGLMSCDPAFTAAPGRYMTAINYTAYPYSRGSVHIPPFSTEPPTHPLPEAFPPLDFTTGFLTDPAGVDLKKLTWAYKLNREVLRRTSFYRGELPGTHPDFAPSSPAALLSLPEDTTLRQHLGLKLDEPIPRIEYTAEDDKAIEAYIRNVINTTWHGLGTAKMAPREAGGVVDKHLGVYGVAGLKVADLSICPENVGANTGNTAMLIGEKAADIVAREVLGRELGTKGGLVPSF